MRKPRYEPAPLPTSGSQLPIVTLRTLHRSTHPWIFARMVGNVEGDLDPGALVEVRDKFGQFIGRGFYNANSEIAVRLATITEQEYPDEQWFAETVTRAVQLRTDILKLPAVCDSYRLIHSEGDGLSGLMADKYGKTIVLQLFSAGAHRHLPWIQPALTKHFPDDEQIIRSDHRSEKLEGVKMDGPPPQTRQIVIHEHNVKLNVDLRRGHKTGFFLDQRDNRKRVAELAGGHNVFDGFCYTGGFSLSAALGGAKSVDGVDLDEDAVEVATENKKLNAIDERLKFTHGNVFDVLRDRRNSNQRYSLMILDPAKLASSRADVSKALSAYADMNRLGIQCLEPGGILVSCSCTGLVSEEDFLLALRAAAAEARMDLQVLAIHGAAPDHPWAIRVPEGRYLKVVFSRVSKMA